MFKLAINPFSTDTTLPEKIQRLIFGRFLLIFLLLIASWWWRNNYFQLPASSFPEDLFLLFAVLCGLTIIYLFFLRRGKTLFGQLRFQFLMDALFITWFIWETGDLISPFITLYIILITTVGFFFGKNETLFIAGLCVLSFSLLSFLTGKSLINSFSNDLRPSFIAHVIGFNNVAFLVVGLLAARLSERRKVSEKLKKTAADFDNLNVLHERIVESVPSGLITTDLEGKIYSFNQAAEEISGTSADRIIGGSIFSLFGEEIRRSVENCRITGHKKEFETRHFEAGIRPQNGSDESGQQIAVACSVSPLVSKTDVMYGLILTFQDITQFRAMEETLRRSDRLAAVGRMAAGLAHEIRNPLGSMGAALQFLQEKVPPGTPEASLMEVVLSESERLNKIITNFLAYARPSANIFSKDTTSVMDVGEAIRDCTVLLRHSPDMKDSHVLNYRTPENPIRIRANETQIKQVFWNLLQNSIQAMPDGGKINIGLKETAGDHVEIVFEDTGGGIDSDYLEHIFEPFSNQARGTGLGLSIVHKIINDHNGHIDIRSDAGRGTKIIVELPKRIVETVKESV